MKPYKPRFAEAKKKQNREDLYETEVFLTLDEIIDSCGMDGFNEHVGTVLNNELGDDIVLSDISYAPLYIKNGMIVIQVIATKNRV